MAGIGNGADGSTAVEVVHARPRPAAAFVELLSDDEDERLAALRRADDRDRFATAHALLRVVVAEQAGVAPEELVFGATCRHCGGPHGRPELRSPIGLGLHVSLSRSTAEVLVAITRLGPLGVDIETAVADDFEGFDRVGLTPTERMVIAELAPEERSRGRGVLWARKEAVLKATGHGLMTEPNTIEVSPPFAPPRLVAWHGDDAVPLDEVQLLDVPLASGTCAAVAVLTDRRPDLVVRSGEALLDRA